MKCTFVIGQKVVFVREGRGDIQKKCEAVGFVYPVVDRIYTVRDVRPHSITGVPLLLLSEIDNGRVAESLAYDREPGFDADHFRPLVTRKTDISVFTALLNTSKSPEVA